jgi:TalC/MipB family fructose-6-phosphate aldolase
MALFADSAHLDDVAALRSVFPVTGATTNPSILLAARERGQRATDREIARGLLEICPGPVFMQPSAASAEGLRAAALRYVELEPSRIVVKLPLTPAGLEAAHALREDGARLSFTAVASVAQAYCALLAGAAWVIPYFGRLRRAGVDAPERLAAMARLIAAQHSDARLLVASLKSSADVTEALLSGGDDITAAPEVIRALAADPLTDAAVARFAADWERFQRPDTAP